MSTELRYLIGEEHKPYKVLYEELLNTEVNEGNITLAEEVDTGIYVLENKLDEKKEIIKGRGVEVYFEKTLRDFLSYSEYFIDPKLYLLTLADDEVYVEEDVRELVEIVAYDEDLDGIEDYILSTTTGYELEDIIKNAESEELKFKLRNHYRVELSKKVLKKLEDSGVSKKKVKQMDPSKLLNFIKSARTKKGHWVDQDSIQSWLSGKGLITPEIVYSELAVLYGGGRVKVTKKGKEVAERLVLEIEKSGVLYGVSGTKKYGMPLYIDVEDEVKIVVWEDIAIFRKVGGKDGYVNVYRNPTHKVTVGAIKDIVGSLPGVEK